MNRLEALEYAIVSGVVVSVLGLLGGLHGIGIAAAAMIVAVTIRPLYGFAVAAVAMAVLTNPPITPLLVVGLVVGLGVILVTREESTTRSARWLAAFGLATGLILFGGWAGFRAGGAFGGAAAIVITTAGGSYLLHRWERLTLEMVHGHEHHS